MDKKTSPVKGLKIFGDYLKNIAEVESEIIQVVLAVALMAEVAKNEQLAHGENVLEIGAETSGKNDH